MAGRLAVPALCFLAAHLAAAAVIDLLSGRIPNRLVVSLAAGGLLYRLLSGFHQLIDGLYGSAFCFALLMIISICMEGAMGGGDIKLMAATGLFLGPRIALQALFWTFCAGGAMSILMLLLGLTTIRGSIPYAPAIAIGVSLAIFLGIP